MMTDGDVAAGLFALAKAHRRNAQMMRERANRLCRQVYRVTDAVTRETTYAAAREIRSRALIEDDKATFYKRGAELARLGAASARWNTTPLAMASRPSLADRGLSLLASVLIPKPKGN